MYEVFVNFNIRFISNTLSIINKLIMRSDHLLLKSYLYVDICEHENKNTFLHWFTKKEIYMQKILCLCKVRTILSLTLLGRKDSARIR